VGGRLDGVDHVRASGDGLLPHPPRSARPPLPRFAPERGHAAIAVRDISRSFRVRDGWFGNERRIVAVDDVSLDVAPGSVLGVVGESGCGKSTLARLILGLLPPEAGEILVEGQRLDAMDRRAQPVFQDPFASLNPRRRVGDIVALPLAAQAGIGRNETNGRVAEIMQRVGLSPDMANRLPGELSGGQRQRVAIARALILRPRIVVCDEPTSALDVSVQAQILNLLKSLQDRLGVAYLFITHNMAVVQYLAHEVAVMKQGRIVEQGRAEQVLYAPRHPYTAELLAAVPTLDR